MLNPSLKVILCKCLAGLVELKILVTRNKKRSKKKNFKSCISYENNKKVENFFLHLCVNQHPPAQKRRNGPHALNGAALIQRGTDGAGSRPVNAMRNSPY